MSFQRKMLLSLDEEDVGRHMIIDELRTALRTQPMRYSIKEPYLLRGPVFVPALNVFT